jgi:hypothetical protein
MMTFVGIVFGVVFLTVVIRSMSKTNKQHEDPNDKVVVNLDQLRGLCNLAPGEAYVVFTTRQSGYEHQPRRAFGTIDEAVAAGVSTMKRARIPFAKIIQNTDDRFEFCRPYHDHFGRAEGKKVASIEVVRIV